MTGTSVCPECGSAIGLWAAKFAWFSGGTITCPRCRAPLAFAFGKPSLLLALLGFVGSVIAADLASDSLIRNPWLRPFVDAAFFLILIGLICFTSARFLTARAPLRRKVQDGHHV